ncbi:MAG: hypothetical protein JNK79_13665 [Chitinophagaceae bacterium]|nr:hypothetical protein [Chitinophagaceae bacterium]
MKPLLTILYGMLSFWCFSQEDSSKFMNTIGNNGTVKLLSVAYEVNHDHGHFETGTIVRVCSGPLRVVSAKFLIRSFTTADTFNVNFYKVENDRPATRVLRGPIPVYGRNGKGALNVDLTKDSITMNEDFFIAISKSGGEGVERIEFLAGFAGNKSFHRYDVTGEWEKIPVLKPGFSVKVASDKDLPCTVNVYRLTAFEPGITFEPSINKTQTALLRFYAATSFGLSFSKSQGTNTFLTFDPAATIQYRFYYNGRKRSESGKRTAFNSMNYIAASLDYILTRETLSQLYVVPLHRRPLLQQGVLWGMQRNYPGRFSLDLNVGPGFYLLKNIEENAYGPAVEKMTGRFTVLSHINIGWWLNRR